MPRILNILAHANSLAARTLNYVEIDWEDAIQFM